METTGEPGGPGNSPTTTGRPAVGTMQAVPPRSSTCLAATSAMRRQSVRCSGCIDTEGTSTKERSTETNSSRRLSISRRMASRSKRVLVMARSLGESAPTGRGSGVGRNRAQPARVLAERLDDVDPDLGHGRVGAVEHEARDPPFAVRHLEQLLRLAPQEDDALNGLGVLRQIGKARQKRAPLPLHLEAAIGRPDEKALWIEQAPHRC